MAGPAPRFAVSLDRLDGGEAIEELEVVEVQLRNGIVTILDGETRIFASDAWSWLEVRRIDDAADVSVGMEPRPTEPAPRRPTRQARSK